MHRYTTLRVEHKSIIVIFSAKTIAQYCAPLHNLNIHCEHPVLFDCQSARFSAGLYHIRVILYMVFRYEPSIL